MSTTLRALVQLQNVSSLPEDVATNTWHAMSNLTDEVGDAEAWFDELETFYQSIDGLLSGSTAGIYCKIYDLTSAEPRTAIFEGEFGGLTFATEDPLPHEVAICLSFHGAGGSGVNIARRRGRLYLGPWANTVAEVIGGQCRVTDAARGVISTAAEAMMNAGGAAIWEWSVFSPTTAGAPPWTEGELLAATHQVIGGFVDNAFDTVRSRGTAASARSTFGA